MLIGIIGKPSSGKSTFFKAATLAEVEIANYPFTTIEKNEGVGFVKINCVDKELNTHCKPKHGYCINHTRFVPIKLIDVAGLVPGAHEGKGRGNEFLDDLREADVLIHVVDASGGTNQFGEVVATLSYDPRKDVLFLERELDMWYYQILKKGWERFARMVKQENLDVKKELTKQLSGIKVTEDMIHSAIKKLQLVPNPMAWSKDDLLNLATLLRKLSKPIIIAANKMDIQGSKFNLDRLQAECKDYLVIPCSAESEVALREAAKHNLISYIPGESTFTITGELNEKQEKGLAYIKQKVLDAYTTSGVQDVLNKAVFDFLGYIAVYPVSNSKLADKDGNILPDCFLIHKDETALDLAFKIHSDIGKNFIKAMNVKTKHVIGKEVKLKHSDVIEIITK